MARDIFRELIEIDTTARFGSTRAAEAMAARLKAAGFTDVHIAGPSPTKMNLVARLNCARTGAGTAKPVLFIAHLDVVEARKEDWSTGLNPFRFTERDGYFYGRGTTDVKGACPLNCGLIHPCTKAPQAPRRLCCRFEVAFTIKNLSLLWLQ